MLTTMAPATGERARRIFELVPRGLDEDPRIGWVTDLCREIAWTGVLAATSRRAGPFREYDGRVFVERTNVYAAAPLGVNALDLATGALSRLAGGRPGALHAAVRRQLVARALARRARAESILPRLVVAHGLEGLIAGALLKGEIHCRLVYDANAVLPEADGRAPARIESGLIHHADGVVTASPLLARRLAAEHRLDGVVVAANAAPLEAELPPVGRPSRPIRVVYQGPAVPALGRILDAWSGISPHDAVLVLRVPDDSSAAELERTQRGLVAAGRLEFARPVGSRELIRASIAADVGVAPLTAPGANAPAAPHELSAYLQAGLATLADRRGPAAATVKRYECGSLFDVDRPETVVAAVQSLVDDLPGLEALKRRARAAAESEYNWTAQSASYRRLLEELAA
jgi:hypothetical protein